MKWKVLARVAAVSSCLLGHAAFAETIEPSAAQNPPPSMALASFDQFELVPIEMGAPYAKNKGNQKAVAKLQEHLERDLGSLLQDWNNKASRNEPPRKMLIQPRVEKIRFIGGGKRFFAGAFAGKSAILMRVRFVDAASGEEIADPEFYQHAAAMAGAWSVGGADNAMLARESTLIVQYVAANYEEAIGGPTRLPDEQKGEKEQ